MLILYLCPTLAADLLPRSWSSLLRSKINSALISFFFLLLRCRDRRDATLMLLTVYLLPDRKGKKRKVFQTDTSA